MTSDAARRALVVVGGAATLAVVAVVLGVGHTSSRAAGRGPRCFVAVEDSDAPAGWRRVPLPMSAPALAAPPGVPQFRSDEDAVVWTSELGPANGARRVGRTTFVLTVPAHVRHAALRFRAALDGARVEVRDEREETIFDRRISGAAARAD